MCVRGGSSKLTFNCLNLYSSPILPANFLTLLFFLVVWFYAALSDNTLEAILELISLIGNKLQLFLQLQTAFLSYYKHQRIEKNVGLGNEKNTSASFPGFLPLHTAWLYGEIIITAEGVGRFTLKVPLHQRCQFLLPCFNNNAFVGLSVAFHDSIKNR